MPGFTLIVPAYRCPAMLLRQAAAWADYPPNVRVIVVDDGSPEPLAPIIEGSRAEVYRITVDIPWNRGGARNLGASVARTDWIVHVDVDHILPAPAAAELLRFEAQPDSWYRFPRWRIGAADETRRKDKVPDDAEFAQIHPHIDSYLIERAAFWKYGPYDEDYSGCLGGGTPFLKGLERHMPVQLLPESIPLHVYTRGACPDASVFTLSRETGEFTRRRKAKEARGDTRPHSPIRFPWERVA